MSKGEATRQRIIEIAAPLFNQRGYKGCSLHAIMEATGLEKGGIYRHFGSKEELAAEAFDFAWNTTFALRTNGLDAIPNHVDRLKEHVSRYAYRSGIPGGCPLLNTAVDADDGNPVLRERVRKALRGWQNALRSVLEDGIAKGTVNPEIDPAEVANHIITSIEGGIVIARLERSDNALRDARARLDRYLELKVRKSPSAESPSSGTHPPPALP
ncbi:TetR/AcrR family transcriptional regulator [Edaphobacter bradus]|uniref:TetR/AcrR family transcriptional regulator n=1 Tax=Edaphobacter bradus TaxID=2259016 RepID=UPI0021DFA8BD|nr:TetR/AcrR family transcriptional regulator [Edaphobacter bradus]